MPIAGILGDQQAALVGQTCFRPGEAKNTYGTGCFLLMNTGPSSGALPLRPADHGGFKLGDQPAHYALEGSVAITGALVQWLRDNFGLIAVQRRNRDAGAHRGGQRRRLFRPGVLRPVRAVLERRARGVIAGLTRYANKGHLARAVLEATAFQTREVVEAMEQDSGIRLDVLRADGGMVENELLMQFQADILDRPVVRPVIKETTALGAAYAAGLATGFFRDLDELRANWQEDRSWTPRMDGESASASTALWKKAVTRSFDWVEPLVQTQLTSKHLDSSAS